MSNSRMCIVCRKRAGKDELNRFIKHEDTIEYDESGKAQSRGFYICKTNECVERAIKTRVLNKIYKKQIDLAEYEKLRAKK